MKILNKYYDDIINQVIENEINREIEAKRILLNYKYFDTERLIEDGYEILEYNEFYLIAKRNYNIHIYPRYKILSSNFDKVLIGRVTNYYRNQYFVSFNIYDNFKLDELKSIIDKIYK